MIILTAGQAAIHHCDVTTVYVRVSNSKGFCLTWMPRVSFTANVDFDSRVAARSTSYSSHQTYIPTIFHL